MENASKALIIAGAILIAILLIGIGMFLYTSAQEPIGEAQDQMSEQAVRMFNSKFENYSGSQKGVNVKALLSTVISSNSNDSADARLVTVKYGSSTGSDSSTISTIVNSIVNTKTYTVNLTYTGQLISQIEIVG